VNWYLDSSAILKLIIQEPESDALDQMLGESLTSSILSRIEIMRVIQRNHPDRLSLARAELGKINLIPINEAVIRIAENFSEASTLRSLDAIHIASALLVQSSIEGIITYDTTMVTAAKEFGLQVLSPR